MSRSKTKTNKIISAHSKDSDQSLVSVSMKRPWPPIEHTAKTGQMSRLMSSQVHMWFCHAVA